MTKLLETERLTLRPMVLDDAPAMFEIYKDARAMIFMPTLPHESVDQTHNALMWSMHQQGAVKWAICIKGNDTAIGHVHYLGQTRIQGMGYILHPDYWGQGLTTEACRTALDYGFTELGYDKVELWIDEKNGASLKVAQKLGFRLKGKMALKYQHEPTHHISLVWGLRKNEWLSDDTVEDKKSTEFLSIDPILNVHDVVATTEYYRDKLGFHIDFLYGDPPNHAGVSDGEWSGSVVSIQFSQVAPEITIKPSGNLRIMVSNSIDKLADTYRANDVKIIEEPNNKPWGYRECTIKDLNGHIIVFAAYI